MCQCMGEVSRQIRHCGFKCRERGMEYFACLQQVLNLGSHKQLTLCFATGNFANPEKKIECACSKTTMSYEFL